MHWGPFTVLCVCVLAACAAGTAPQAGSGPRGRPNRGFLTSGVALERDGNGYVLARPTDPTRYGSPTLIAALTRATREVAERFPGSAPLRIGDLSYPQGGRHPRHGSHQSGSDADLIFYATDAYGRSVTGRGWLAFDRFGVARERRSPGDRAPSNKLFFFDVARNWHLVRTLLDDRDAMVQWIFCSNGVKARLLRYAIANEPDPRLIARAAVVLHQPSLGRPHNDHFHVRILCSHDQYVRGCRNYGPMWPWLRARAEDAARGAADEVLDDAALLAALLEPDGEEPALGADP